MTDRNDDPTITTEIDVHGTSAWVIISRDQPLGVLTMSYRAARKLHADLGRLLEGAT